MTQIDVNSPDASVERKEDSVNVFVILECPSSRNKKGRQDPEEVEVECLEEFEMAFLGKLIIATTTYTS